MSESKNHPEPLVEQLERYEESAPAAPARKPFVEPAVSVPVDVLEATSFFQVDTTIDTSDV